MGELYSDYTRQFPYHQVTIYGEFSTALAAGLMEGFYFGIFTVVNIIQDPAIKEALLNVQASFRVAPLPNPSEVFTYEHYELTLKQPKRNDLLRQIGYEKYILVTNADIGPQAIDIHTFDTELELREFLRGFLTIIRSFNIDLEHVFPIAPLRGNQNYSINGIHFAILQ